MSTAGDDVWDSIKRCMFESELRRLSANHLFQCLSEREIHERWYARGLRRISSTLSTGENTEKFGLLIAAISEECEARAVSAEKLSKKLSELLDPIRELLKAEEIAAKIQSIAVEKARKEVNSYRDRLEMAQDCYWMQFQATEELVARIENAATLLEKKKLVKIQPSDVNLKMEVATKAYRDALSAYNHQIPKQQEFVSTLLASLKIQKEERLNLLSSSLQKIHTASLEGLITLQTVNSRLSAVTPPTGLYRL